jgi:hypothetical protein
MRIQPDGDLLRPENIARPVRGPSFEVANDTRVSAVLGACLVFNLFVAAKVLGGLARQEGMEVSEWFLGKHPGPARLTPQYPCLEQQTFRGHLSLFDHSDP